MSGYREDEPRRRSRCVTSRFHGKAAPRLPELQRTNDLKIDTKNYTSGGSKKNTVCGSFLVRSTDDESAVQHLVDYWLFLSSKTDRALHPISDDQH